MRRLPTTIRYTTEGMSHKITEEEIILAGTMRARSYVCSLHDRGPETESCSSVEYVRQDMRLRLFCFLRHEPPSLSRNVDGLKSEHKCGPQSSCKNSIEAAGPFHLQMNSCLCSL
jgi:hypothetical protein